MAGPRLQIGSSSFGAGTQYDLGTLDDLYVLPGAQIVSSEDFAVRAAGGNHKIRVLGLVGGQYGINVSDDDGDRAVVVTVSLGGTINSLFNAIVIRSNGASIYNYGEISSEYYPGITIENFQAYNPTEFLNYGTISGSSGITINNSLRNTITNYGTITGKYYTIVGGSGDDLVTNHGRIQGIITLALGNDTLLNRGLIDGDVELNSGDDLLDNRGQIEGIVSLGNGFRAFSTAAESRGIPLALKF